MEIKKTAFGLMVAMMLGVASAAAFAQHHGGGGHFGGGHGGGWHGGGHWQGGGVGIYFGAPLFWPGYYGPYYYDYPNYYPPVVTVPATPPTYIEQGQDEQAGPGQNSGYWYYCPDSKTYYPYVKVCASGWQQVVPQPQQ